jgi:hypothetical protein
MTQQPLLHKLAAKYIWWKRPDEALQYPERVVLQVMNIGDYEDVQELVDFWGSRRCARSFPTPNPVC